MRSVLFMATADECTSGPRTRSDRGRRAGRGPGDSGGSSPRPPPGATASISAWLPAQQHVGHGHAAELPRPRVVRVIEQPGSLNESCSCDSSRPITPGTSRVTASISDERGQLPAREHVVPDRDLLGGKPLDDALVHALVAPAQQREVALGRRARARALDRAGARRARAAAPAHGRGRATRRLGTRRRASSPCRARRRTAHRRPCGAGRRSSRAGRGRGRRARPPRSPCRAGSGRAAPAPGRGRS